MQTGTCAMCGPHKRETLQIKFAQNETQTILRLNREYFKADQRGNPDLKKRIGIAIEVLEEIYPAAANEVEAYCDQWRRY